jgi:hypothetical protein
MFSHLFLHVCHVLAAFVQHFGEDVTGLWPHIPLQIWYWRVIVFVLESNGYGVSDAYSVGQCWYSVGSICTAV